MCSGASVETTGTGGDMSKRLWWATFGLYLLVWISAVVTRSRVFTVIELLILIVLATDTWRKYHRKGGELTSESDEGPVAEEE